MPLFLVERNFAEPIQLGPEDLSQINQLTDEIVEVSQFWPQTGS